MKTLIGLLVCIGLLIGCANVPNLYDDYNCHTVVDRHYAVDKHGRTILVGKTFKQNCVKKGE